MEKGRIFRVTIIGLMFYVAGLGSIHSSSAKEPEKGPIKSTEIIAQTSETKEQLKLKLRELRSQLAGVKAQAEKDVEVTAARDAIDEAFRDYYEILRAKMIQLDPKVVPLLEQEKELRFQIKSKPQPKP